MRFTGIQDIDELVKVAESTVTLGRITPAGSSFFVGPWHAEHHEPMNYLYTEREPAVYASTVESLDQWCALLKPSSYAESVGMHENKTYDFYLLEAEKDSFLDIEEWFVGERLVPINSIKEIRLMLSNEPLDNIFDFVQEIIHNENKYN